jgi:phosphoribosyl-ATP pyrophosphohydrolase/phosphoribosyl-AMP cyclohydrolase
MSEIKFDEKGLVPVIVQDAVSNEVLMMAWANQEAYDLMLSTGYTHFWSRSRAQMWKKGETSGHVQKIVSMHLDCDGDTLLVRVEQTGVACHTGAPTCFNETLYGSDDSTMAVLPDLARVIHDRKLHPKEGSYTNKLLADEDKRLKKVIEEAGEVALACKGHDPKAEAWEVADLIYHLMVAVEGSEISMRDVYSKLAERRK